MFIFGFLAMTSQILFVLIAWTIAVLSLAAAAVLWFAKQFSDRR